MPLRRVKSPQTALSPLPQSLHTPSEYRLSPAVFRYLCVRMGATLSRAIPQGPRTAPVTALWVKGLGGGKTQSPPPTGGTRGLLSSCLWEGRGWLCCSMTHLMDFGVWPWHMGPLSTLLFPWRWPDSKMIQCEQQTLSLLKGTERC